MCSTFALLVLYYGIEFCYLNIFPNASFYCHLICSIVILYFCPVIFLNPIFICELVPFSLPQIVIYYIYYYYYYYYYYYGKLNFVRHVL